MEKVTKREINIEIDDKVATGIYANMVVVNHSDTEFVLDFISTPSQAKHLMQNLSTNLYQYEHDKDLPTDEEVFGKQSHFSGSGEA